MWGEILLIHQRVLICSSITVKFLLSGEGQKCLVEKQHTKSLDIVSQKQSIPVTLRGGAEFQSTFILLRHNLDKEGAAFCHLIMEPNVHNYKCVYILRCMYGHSLCTRWAVCAIYSSAAVSHTHTCQQDCHL